MPIKQTKVYFCEQFPDYQQYLKELRSVTATQVPDIMSAIHNPGVCGDGCCIKKMTCEHISDTEPHHSHGGEIYIKNIEFNGKPLCMSKDPNDDIFRLLHCQTNIMSGKCLCPYMGPVGKILFPNPWAKHR
jgi:hypothetical protein